MNLITKYKKGFTLIELLVVIAVIGLLSSIVLANLGNARLKAQDAKVVTELRQIQISLELYYNTYGAYPNPGTGLMYCIGSTSCYFNNQLISQTIALKPDTSMLAAIFPAFGNTLHRYMLSGSQYQGYIYLCTTSASSPSLCAANSAFVFYPTSAGPRTQPAGETCTRTYTSGSYSC